MVKKVDIKIAGRLEFLAAKLLGKPYVVVDPASKHGDSCCEVTFKYFLGKTYITKIKGII